MQLTINGIVLRDYKIQEDRRLTLLTDALGVVEAWANGANKTRSRLAAPTELLCYSQLILFQSRGRYTVDKADPKRLFFGIRSDLDKLALGSYLAEVTAELAPHGEEAGTYLSLLLNALHLLEEGRRPPLQLKAICELRLLTLAGYMPDLVACQGCGCYECDTMYFLPRQGELRCENCMDGRPGGTKVRPGVLAAMRHIAYAPADKLFFFQLSDAGMASLSRVVEDYLKCQVEKTFPTLEFYHSLCG